MKIYTRERLAQMSQKEKHHAAYMVRTSKTLSVLEKEANLKLLEGDSSRDVAILKDIEDGRADIGDIGQ